MAAFIPSRRDPEVNEIALAKVREDKIREASDGFDGTWVAHPDLVPTATGRVRRACSATGRTRSTGSATTSRSPPPTCSTSPSTPGDVTEAGVRNERPRRHPVHRLLAARHRRGRHQQPDGGRRHRRDLPLADLAVGAARARRPGARRRDRRPRSWPGSARRYARRPRSSEEVALADEFVDFLTLPAYDRLP